MFFYKYVYIYKRVHFPHAGDWLSKVLVTCKVQDEFNNLHMFLQRWGNLFISLVYLPWGFLCFHLFKNPQFNLITGGPRVVSFNPLVLLVVGEE